MQNIEMWVVVLVYLATIIIIGFAINRREKNVGMNDYYVSQRSLPPIVIAFSLVATSQSGMVFLGAPGTCTDGMDMHGRRRFGYYALQPCTWKTNAVPWRKI